MASASNASLSDLRDQPLHQVEPTAAGRGEVDLVTRVASQPAPNLSDFVRSVVVHHQMNVQPFRQAVLDLVEETQKLLMPVLPEAGADRHSRGYIHCGEQGGQCPFGEGA